jgi:hypothetical protein
VPKCHHCWLSVFLQENWMLFLSAGFFLPWIRHRWPSDYAYELGLVVEERRMMVILGIKRVFCGYTNHLLQNMGHKLWVPKFSQGELKSQHLHLAFLNLWTVFNPFSM